MIRWSGGALTAPAGGGTTCWPPVAVAGDDPLDHAPDVLVVGAGVAGAAIGHACSRAGYGVQVIDRHPLASGVTQRSAGALIPEVHAGRVPAILTQLGRRGLLLHRKLAADLGHRLDALDWLDLTSPPEPAVDRTGGAGLLDRDDIAALVPCLRSSGPGRLVHDQAQVDPVEVTASLLQSCRLTVGVTATDARTRSDGAIEVRTSHGTITPRWLVVASGQLPAPLSERVQGVRGHLVAVDLPAGTLPPRLGIGGPVVVLPAPDGGVIAGGTRDGSTPTSHPVRDVVAGIRSQLGALVPAAREAPLRAAWVGFRPTVGDRLPVVGWLPGAERVLVVGGLYHTGVLLAPAIGELVVEAIGAGRQLPRELGCERSLT